MSLLTDASIRKYYDDASRNIENSSSAFWFGILRRSFGHSFEINPCYSPDGSDESVDAAVEKLEGTQEHRIVLLWVECKRQTDTLQDIEEKALEAAVRCLDSQNLASIYAITTMGVRFRMWQVFNHSARLTRLIPWHGTDTKYDESQYVDADSPEAVVFTQAVSEIHAESVDAPALQRR